MSDVDYTVYLNVIRFLKYRYNEDIKEDKNNFKSNIINKDYFDITIKDKVSVIIAAKDGRYSNLHSDTKKLILDKIKTGRIRECVLITDIELRNERGTNNIKAMNKFAATFNDVWVQVRPKTTFYFYIPNMVPPHKIVDKDKFVEHNLDYINTLDSMERIYEFDPPVTWIGGCKDDIIEVERPSIGTIKSSIIYKKVII